MEAFIDETRRGRSIRANQNQIRACYEDRSPLYADLQGTARARFEIDPSGSVSTFKIEGSTVRNAPLESCLAERVKRWTFPPATAGGATTVTASFFFRFAKEKPDGEPPS